MAECYDDRAGQSFAIVVALDVGFAEISPSETKSENANVWDDFPDPSTQSSDMSNSFPSTPNSFEASAPSGTAGKSSTRLVDIMFGLWVGIQIGSGVALLRMADMVETGDEEGLLAAIMVWFLLLIGATVARMTMLYQFWSRIPPSIARTTPGKAIGLLFVPLYNIYWLFVAIRGLAQDMNTTLARTNSPRRISVGLATIVCACELLSSYVGRLELELGLIMGIFVVISLLELGLFWLFRMGYAELKKMR